MKKFKDWDASGKSFTNFAQPGDAIDKKTYFYFLEVLMPKEMTPQGFLMGEPFGDDGNGNFTYMTFIRKGRTHYYMGTMTTFDFLQNYS